MPRLIIIDGKPGSGKTTLADIITDRLGLPVMRKDSLKEYLFDAVGTGDRAWSHVLGAAAYEMLYVYMEELLKKGEDILIESPFWADFAAERIQNMAQTNRAEVLELYCYADAQTRSKRAEQRLESRHKGHVDQELQFDDVVDDVRYRPLDIGKTIKIDTAQLSVDNYDGIMQEITEFLKTKEGN